jgi:hypothetical protein
VVAAGGPGRSLDDFDAAVRKAAVGRLGDLADWSRSRDERSRALDERIKSFNARTATPVSDDAEFRALQKEQNQLKSDVDSFNSLNAANAPRLDLVIRRWTAPVPELAHVSGIRERAFTRTEADCFVAEGREVPAVLDFLIQITYDSPPYFLKGAPPDSEDKAAWEALTAFADDAPWEFPEVSGRVREVVRKALADDPAMAEDRDAVAVLSEFTVLQRLFRLGLTGELGPDFPVESLALLHRDAAPAAPPPPVRTPRWDTRPGLLEHSLKAYAGRELALNASRTPPAALPASLVTDLEAVAAAAEEYAAKVAERDKALAALDDASPGGPGVPSPSWESTWEAFQTWAVDWEDRLAKLSNDLEQRSAAGSRPVPPNLTSDGQLRLRKPNPLVPDGPADEEKTEEIVASVRWTASAVALRRALGVQADDRVAVAGKRGRTAATEAPRPGP